MQESELEVNARHEGQEVPADPVYIPYPIYMKSDNEFAIDHYLGNSVNA